ncbi:molybdate ABC transporter substrate-binding protein [Otoolea muris]|uniref:molybdate ABC transporter substrate-binding protein n=1 Tax=Otoolea muris TaxID=2941515 RepID=UPI002F40794F
MRTGNRIRRAAVVLMAAAMAAASGACAPQKAEEPAVTEAAEIKAAAADKTDGETPDETGQAAEQETQTGGGTQEILVAAAASLQYVMEDAVQPAFEKECPDVKLKFTFDSSGKLQAQIEEGADADVFFSAAMKQMKALEEENLIDTDSVVGLLENKIALIVPKGSEAGITSFEDITKAEKIAVGDPQSVPVGQYAKECFESLGMWEEVQAKASFGTNVTEVLSWVAAGSADAGIVYLTDATTSDQFDKVEVIGFAPEGSVTKVIYPVGIVSGSGKKEAAARFLEYLQTEEALAAFAEYGFSANAQ